MIVIGKEARITLKSDNPVRRLHEAGEVAVPFLKKEPPTVKHLAQVDFE